MNIYRIGCWSECGTYFASYLQWLMVLAETKEEAVILAKKWLDKEGRSFIRKNEMTWSIELISDNVSKGVIDWHEDSDY